MPRKLRKGWAINIVKHTLLLLMLISVGVRAEFEAKVEIKLLAREAVKAVELHIDHRS